MIHFSISTTLNMGMDMHRSTFEHISHVWAQARIFSTSFPVNTTLKMLTDGARVHDFPEPFLVNVLQLLWKGATLTRLVDAYHPVAKAERPLCNSDWWRAWNEVFRRGRGQALVLWRRISASGRSNPLYIFDAKKMRAVDRWLWLSYKLQKQNGFVLQSDILWPGQTREFLQLSRTQRHLHVVALVREKLDSVVLLPLSVPNVEHQSQGRKLCFNEWRVLTATISDQYL